MLKPTLVALAIAGTLLTSHGTKAHNHADSTAAVTAETVQQTLLSLTDEYLEKTLPRSPLNAMFFGDNRFNHLWPNNLTDEFIQQGVAINKQYLARLRNINRDDLEGQDRYTFDIFKLNLEQGIKGAQYPAQLLPLNQFIFSPQNLIIQLGAGLSAQPFNSAQDFDNFLQRLAGFADWMAQAEINMAKGVEQGIVLPDTIVQSMIPQFEAQILEDASKSALLTPLNSAGDKLSDADKTRLRAAYIALIDERITPAFASMAKFLKQSYLPHARNTDGFGDLPGGKAWYEFAIQTNTTLPLSADTLHQTGLNEVKRIHNEMRSIAEEVKFDGDLEAFFTHLETSPEFYFDSSEEVLAAYTELKQTMAPKVSKLFSVIPESDYVVRPYPESQAQSAPGASYIPGAPDGSRPGVFFANTYNLKAQPKFGTETLSIHEAVPGHHFQISLQNEVKGLPKIRQQNFYTAYAEGWALYAESLGKELGMFTDPYQYYGKLDAELFRAMRLVVDTGLHYKGWSREQAIKYLTDNSTMTESAATAEIERYMIMPGQALAYKTGQLKIQALREKAEAALGSQFDIKHFHNLILLDGPLPLTLLERKIDDWIAESPRT